MGSQPEVSVGMSEQAQLIDTGPWFILSHLTPLWMAGKETGSYCFGGWEVKGAVRMVFSKFLCLVGRVYSGRTHAPAERALWCQMWSTLVTQRNLSSPLRSSTSKHSQPHGD